MSLTLKLNMTMKKIEIEIPDGKRAEWVNGVLTLVNDTPKDVTERIKTFEDACAELGNEHPFVKSYEKYVNIASDEEAEEADVIAYLKLRIIVDALNEGWKPQFTKNEQRWFPWFKLWSGKERSMIGKAGWKDDKHIISTDGYLGNYAAFICSASSYICQDTAAYIGPYLCLKNKELAEYCGGQFISLWADFCLIKK